MSKNYLICLYYFNSHACKPRGVSPWERDRDLKGNACQAVSSFYFSSFLSLFYFSGWVRFLRA